MKLVFQRVASASVTADGVPCGAIGPGAVLLLGVEMGDGEREARFLAEKAVRLRVFSDADGKFRDALTDIGGGVLVVSNFTLCADCRHGRRPDFMKAERPEPARQLYECFLEALRGFGFEPVSGVFGADMRITMEADGPVTVVLDTAELLPKEAGICRS